MKERQMGFREISGNTERDKMLETEQHANMREMYFHGKKKNGGLSLENLSGLFICDAAKALN